MLQNKRFIGCTEGDSVPSEVSTLVSFLTFPQIPMLIRNTQFIPRLVEMQKRGDFPIQELCSFYPYTEIDRAVADVQAGHVSISRPLI
jgi:hypothetical protein